jgi:hypothetical protein
MRQLLTGTLAFLGFPVFGMLAVVVGSLFSAVLFARRPPFVSWDEREFDEAHPPDSPVLAELAPALKVEPLADLLTGDDPDLKRAAVDALLKTQGHLAIGNLKTLLHDRDLEVRLSASLRLVALEDELGQDIQTAQAAVEQSPDNAGAWSSLARACVKYASSGLVDDSASRQYLSHAVDAYAAALRLFPRQHRLALAIGRAYLELGELALAQPLLEHAAQGEAERIEAQVLLMDVAYRRGALVQLARRAAVALGETPPSHHERQFLEWWASVA